MLQLFKIHEAPIITGRLQLNAIEEFEAATIHNLTYTPGLAQIERQYMITVSQA